MCPDPVYAGCYQLKIINVMQTRGYPGTAWMLNPIHMACICTYTYTASDNAPAQKWTCIVSLWLEDLLLHN